MAGRVYNSHTCVMHYEKACFMHHTPGVVHNFRLWVSGFPVPCAQTDSSNLLEKSRGEPRDSGLLSQL